MDAENYKFKVKMSVIKNGSFVCSCAVEQSVGDCMNNDSEIAMLISTAMESVEKHVDGEVEMYEELILMEMLRLYFLKPGYDGDGGPMPAILKVLEAYEYHAQHVGDGVGKFEDLVEIKTSPKTSK